MPARNILVTYNVNLYLQLADDSFMKWESGFFKELVGCSVIKRRMPVGQGKYCQKYQIFVNKIGLINFKRHTNTKVLASAPFSSHFFNHRF